MKSAVLSYRSSAWHRRLFVAWLVTLVSTFVLMAFAVRPANAQGILNVPRTDEFGSPLDVGLLILGHSTSAVGDWPTKARDALHATPADGRNYVVFRNIVGGDGGFLWSRLSLTPDDVQYERIRASQPQQYCEDADSVRWSCRRLLVERSLTGLDPAPSCCTTHQPPTINRCTWHEGGNLMEEMGADFLDCWRRMDVRLALIQDSTNRSWPVDDIDGDGEVGPADAFYAPSILPEALPCGGTSGVIGDLVDWNCDAQINAIDAAEYNYARWLRQLANRLLEGFGDDGVDHVLVSAKPVEQATCEAFPDESCCGQPGCDLRHETRVPTPSRPFSRFYLPSVYWEHRGVQLLAELPETDPRIHLATPWSALEMWDRSAACYEQGVGADVWTIPEVVGRPDAIVADDLETDGVDDHLVGCFGADHVHHNSNGGWDMADVWYRSLLDYLGPNGLFADGVESGDTGRWSAVEP